MIDQRYLLAKERFESLSNEEIQRILNNIDIICWDTFNFDNSTDTFCPIAIAMNLHNTVSNPTDDLIKEEIGKRFQPTNIFKGIPGIFYTVNRKEDTINLCNQILRYRKGLTFNSYQSKTDSTDIYTPAIEKYVDGLEIPNKSNADNLKNLLGLIYPILGLCGEAGELANKMKKVLRENNGILNLSTLLNLAKENGDCTWYNARIFKHVGLTYEEGVQMNLDKISKRKEIGTLPGSGDNR